MFRILFALSITIFLYSFASAATLIQSSIPSIAPFRKNETNWDFGKIAQGRTASSFFDVKNVSSLPVLLTINTVKNFTVNPSAIQLSPNQTKRITITLVPNTPIGSLATTFFFQANGSGQTQKVTSWAIFGDVVPPLPDLTGTVALQGSPQPVGSKFKISLVITVSNPINLVASKACEGQVFLDSNRVLTFSVPALTPGLSSRIFQNFETNKTGAHIINVKIDTNNANQELSESNNNASLNINIQ